jgi:hypothetical protein
MSLNLPCGHNGDHPTCTICRVFRTHDDYNRLWGGAGVRSGCPLPWPAAALQYRFTLRGETRTLSFDSKGGVCCWHELAMDGQPGWSMQTEDGACLLWGMGASYTCADFQPLGVNRFVLESGGGDWPAEVDVEPG